MDNILRITDKQKGRINKLLKYANLEEIKAYFYKKFPKGDYDNMTRKEAQKVITGMDYKVPSPFLRNVVGRDVRG